jgi:hypothetical protein
MRTGQCHCGGIRYALEGEPMHHTLCHCTDCRRHAGAPMVGWAMFKSDQVKVTQGEPKSYASSENGRRHFCPDCGTGLFYTNDAMLPSITDVQSATLDDPDSLAPTAHIQVADRIAWMKDIQDLPEFPRFPGG